MHIVYEAVMSNGTPSLVYVIPVPPEEFYKLKGSRVIFLGLTPRAVYVLRSS